MPEPPSVATLSWGSTLSGDAKVVIQPRIHNDLKPENINIELSSFRDIHCRDIGDDALDNHSARIRELGRLVMSALPQ